MAPKGTKASKQSLPSKTLVVDNGAYTIKAGFVHDQPDADRACVEIPNCLAKTARNHVLTGSELLDWTDFAETTFRRPLQKGHLVSWEAEKQIWDHEFLDPKSKLHCDPHETNLLLAETPNGLSSLQTNCDQMVFEEYEFAGYRRCIGPALNAYNNIAGIFGDVEPTASRSSGPAEAVLVVDSGYSHTTVTPMYQGRPIQQAIQRLDVGGKFLSNYLKELLSIRQMDIRAETHMTDVMKEDVCFISHDFRGDLERTKHGTDKDSSIMIDYVLPDYTTRSRGEIRPHELLRWKQMRMMGFVQNEDGERESFLKLGTERFAVPELLFNPKDVGINQPGLPQTVMRSLSKVPTGLWPVMLANILVVGGNAKIEGLMGRLYAELRQLAPLECVVRAFEAPNPIKSTWLGGATLCSDQAALKEVMITRQDYQEHGAHWLHSKFSSGAAKQ